ncbi:MAG: hypothetical protein H7Y88_10705 [Phycisphaerales bacterium]|nr:hypothetical protein [Phycisphaerales bacterium]
MIARSPIPTPPRTRQRSRAAALGAVLAGAVFLAAAPAAAQPNNRPRPGQNQAASELRPPIPSLPSKPASNFMMILVGVILTGLVVGANMIPSKRSHQD